MTDRTTREVSLIICTLDRPQALDRCLRAILGSDCLPASIIVVDQGSGGVEPSVAAALHARGVAFSHVRMHERGVSRGRNLGVSLADSELVAFTDDDCVPHEDWLGMLARACQPGIDGVAGRVLPLPSADPDLVPISCRLSTTPALYRGVGPHTPWDVGTGGNLLLRRTVFQQIEGFDERLGPGTNSRAAEDIDLLYRVLRAGFTFVYEPRAVVFHQMRKRRDFARTGLYYGFGMGVFLGGHASHGDLTTLSLLRHYGSSRVSDALQAIRQADGAALAHAALGTIGVIAGFGVGGVRGAMRTWWRGTSKRRTHDPSR